MPSIYNYTDFRKFLSDRFVELKADNKHFTYRYIAAKAGFKSPGFFTQVLQSKSNLSDRLIPNLGLVFCLKPRDSHYLELMVHYNQAVSHVEKRHFFGKMVACKKAQINTIGPDAYEFYDKWYYSAIRAILHYNPFEGDYKKLAKMIIPSITVAEAKKAIAVLCRLGFIEKADSGMYTITNKNITTGLNTDSVIINNFLINTLDIAKDAFYNFPKEKRSFSALTASVSDAGYEMIKKRIDEFRSELVELVKMDKGIDRVYQVNIQLFPMTEVEKEKAL
jgi:uncharacterized protein (TIGR02147 family)